MERLFVIEHLAKTLPWLPLVLDRRTLVGFDPLGNELPSVHLQTATNETFPGPIYRDEGQLLLELDGRPTWIDASGRVQESNAARTLGPYPDLRASLVVEPDSTFVTMQTKLLADSNGFAAIRVQLHRMFLNDSPAGMLQAPSLRRFKSGSYHFNIVWRDDEGVDLATVRSSTIQVVLPDGTSKKAYFASADKSNNDKIITATYRMAAPGGTWDFTDRGSYTVKVLSRSVRDVNGNAASRRSIGVFEVAIPKMTVSAAAPLVRKKPLDLQRESPPS